MKKIIFPILIGSIFTYGVAVGHYKIFPFEQIQSIKHLTNTNTNTNHLSTNYIQHQNLFNNLIQDYDVIFLGDSITNAGRWSEFFPNYKVANRGIGGDSSIGVLKRLDTVIDSKPKTVFIMLGINDIASNITAENVFSNYTKIVDTLIDNNINIVIQSTLLSYNKKWNSEVNILNEKLITLSKEKGITYIDLNSIFAPNGILERNVSIDGVHLHSDEYLKWRQAIINTGIIV